MKINDVIVIGSGLSGLIAAATAAKIGKQVLLLTYGAGAFTIGGGIIDVLGYSEDAQPLVNPWAGLEGLAATHPYKKIGSFHIAEAIDLFKNIAKAEGYPYLGDLNKMQWVPTAAGTLKPTCLVPKTMDGEALHQAEKVVVVGFDCLKDFYPYLVVKNLQTIYKNQKQIKAQIVNFKFERGRDVTTLDIARWIDTKEGRTSLIHQLTDKVKPDTTIVLPQVLGTNSDYEVIDHLETALHCRFVETVSLPPAVAGLRLRTMLLKHLTKLGVKVIEKAKVSGAVVSDGRCSAIMTSHFDRERIYYAESFVLASGGLYGGGLQAEPGHISEPVFNLPVTVPMQPEAWSNTQLFSNEKQPFAQFGINVNELMSPLGETGELLLSNVKVVGRNLCGYDFCLEKSGNGVALASGYKAAMTL